MDDGIAAPDAQQPMKQAVEQPAAAAAEAHVPNGVHAEEASASVPEPEHEAESSTQTNVALAQPASEPADEPVKDSEQHDDAQSSPEGEAAADQPPEGPSETVPESAPAAAVPREELPIWRKRLWFVRMPKPLEENTSVSSEHELESFKTQVAILNESMNVKRMERDAANELTQTAQEGYNTVRQQYDAKREEAEPHRARRRELREAVNSLQADFKAEYGDLPAKSEEELNAQLGELQHRITHESVTLNEEKAALARIKKLEGAREKVREYGAKAEAVRGARKAAQDASGGSEQLEADVQALFDEMQTQRQILDNYRTKESAVRAELRGIQEERARIKGLQDEAYGRIVGARNQARDKSRVWGDNRRFSQQIRQVLARGEGALAEARPLCDSQMDDAHAMLASDPAFRAEYFKLWEGQRKGPTSRYQDMDDVAAPAGGRGNRGGRGGAESPVVDESSKARAEAVVAAALAQARETIAQQKAKAEEASAPAQRSAADKPPSAEGEGHSSGGDTAAASASAAAAAALGSAPAADKKPTRSRKLSVSKPPAPVLLPPVADDPFELPSAAIKSKETVVDSEVEKERVREQNRAAAADAAARKERQKKAAEEKRRAAESRRKQQEVAAKEAAAKQQPQAAAQQAQAVGSPAAGSPAMSEADGAEVPPSGAEAASATAPAAAAAPSGYDSGSGRPKPKGRAILPQPTPRARMPVKKKNVAVRFLSRSYARLESGATAAIDQGGPLVRQNPALAVAALGVVAILVVVVAMRLV